MTGGGGASGGGGKSGIEKMGGGDGGSVTTSGGGGESMVFRERRPNKDSACACIPHNIHIIRCVVCVCAPASQTTSTSSGV